MFKESQNYFRVFNSTNLPNSATNNVFLVQKLAAVVESTIVDLIVVTFCENVHASVISAETGLVHIK